MGIFMKDDLGWTEYCRALAPAMVTACARSTVSAGPGNLVRALAGALPEWKFRHVLSRGGWYRLGGIIDASGRRVSDSLETWMSAELEAHAGDVASLIDAHGGETLYATRLIGQTHYLVAATGDADDDFLQLEIEDLQEVRMHRLFDDDASSLEELIDPRMATPPQPLGLPFYQFRRIQHIGAFLARMRCQRPEPAPIHRMIEDWTRSSAGSASAMHNHWVLATREHLDRYQQPIFHARPITTLAGDPPEFDAPPDASGLALQNALTHFDHAAGYPMAWFFHLLTSKVVPHWVAQSVVEDSLANYAYLPERDIRVVRDWLHRPYNV